MKLYTLKEFIEKSTGANGEFPAYIASYLNGAPVWSPFSPPKSNLNYLHYPIDFNIENPPAKDANTKYWDSNKDLVTILNIKRFFDMHNLYKQYHDDKIIMMMHEHMFFKFAVKL